MSSARTSEQATNGQPPNYSHTRRSSLGPGTLTDFFSTSRAPTTSAYPGPITSAAAQANRRRMSMSNVSGTSPPRVQTNMASMRRGSISSVSSASSAVDESAIEEGEVNAGSPSSLGGSPFARRLSFGARALRDVRIPQGRNPANFPVSAGAASPTVTRGFWLDGRSGSQSQGSDRDESPVQRRQSISVMPPPVNAISSKDAHDPLQERMLKGDFYMD
ncbi:hypothetical protein L873DRAFT_217488 [Choiromyces venosus 120613-1]|uniref:Uncharacterized protein n=1 Tax=Choiromyces venosus 120613-1 TaxID=1336337 RepID=A0A3N4J6D8_9PEZI|nr:hypothetical protein L873DRAFT_217488 [Choiromyces venosus 120613-1]